MKFFGTSSDEKTAASWLAPRRVLILALSTASVAWILQYALLQKMVGLDVMEAVTWGLQGDVWGNVKHPPLSGWVALFFYRLSGGADWGLYLAAQVCVWAGVLFTWRLARLFWDEYRAGTAAFLLCFMYYYVPSPMKFSTYFVEMALMPAVAWAFFRAMQRKDILSYLLLGLFSGLGVLNKYSIALLFLSIGAVMLIEPEYRKELKTWRPYLALGLFLLVISPHLHYLVTHDFCCISHMGHRIEESRPWYDPILVFISAVSPTVLAVLVLSAAFLFRRGKSEAAVPDRRVFRWSLIFCALPAVLFLTASFCGETVVMLWFSSLASFTGIMVVAFWPRRIDEKVFRNLCWFWVIYAISWFIATGYPLLCRSGARAHTDPRAVTRAALEFWARESGGKPLRLVAGDRWYGCMMVLYSGRSPRLCEIHKELGEHWRKGFLDRIDAEGALVIGSREENFAAFAKAFEEKTGYAIDLSRRITYTYKAPRGKRRERSFLVSRIPPRAERMKARSDQQ
ncbi:MAG: glycosyltransferase family 39 protein [Lentisphaeria bacterium]|nr:glycosyltransferase family 39 protein [Lentisphaeria bacterium]